MSSNSSTIKTNSAKPKKVSGDQGSVEVHSVDDQIKADRYDASVTRTRQGKNPLAGLLHKQRPPGAP